MSRAFLALGANIGNREENLRNAIRFLKRHVEIRNLSHLYETEPVGLREQPWFLNLVAEIETDLPPLELLRSCQEVEQALGRERTVVNGPRTIDLDILLYDDVVMSTGELTLPHPRYRERRFTLAPLAEIAPDLRDPVTGEKMPDMLRKLEGQPVRVLGLLE